MITKDNRGLKKIHFITHSFFIYLNIQMANLSENQRGISPETLTGKKIFSDEDIKKSSRSLSLTFPVIPAFFKKVELHISLVFYLFKLSFTEFVGK